MSRTPPARTLLLLTLALVVVEVVLQEVVESAEAATHALQVRPWAAERFSCAPEKPLLATSWVHALHFISCRRADLRRQVFVKMCCERLTDRTQEGDDMIDQKTRELSICI